MYDKHINTQELLNTRRNMYYKFDVWQSSEYGSYKVVMHLRNSTVDRYFETIAQVNAYIAQYAA